MENLIYHYTDLDALQGIIGKDICLWGTRYDCLNDPYEQMWAGDVIFKSIAQQEEFQDIPIDEIKNVFFFFFFIISFCKRPDYRNMWRLYCNDGNGICLAFDKDVVINHSINNRNNNPLDRYDLFDEVEYSDRTDIDDIVRKKLKKEEYNFMDEEEPSQLMRIAPFIKNKEFAIEEETRYARIRDIKQICFSYNEKKGGVGDENYYMNENDCKYRIRNNKLIPYLDIRFPAEALKEIIVGYALDFNNCKIYLENYLKEFGNIYDSIEIRKSKQNETF